MNWKFKILWLENSLGIAIDQVNLKGKIPITVTGTAVGIISVVGYTPDIFATPIIGYLLDNYPGSLGHQYVFTMLLLFSLLGLWASINFNRNLNTQ